MYQQADSDSLPIETVFSAISDNKSLSLFNIIGIMSGPTTDGQPTGEILYITFESDSQAILHAYQPLS